jgi:hypothetical protein
MRAGLVGGSLAGLALGGGYAAGALDDFVHGRPLGDQSNLFGIDLLGDRAAGNDAANQVGMRRRIVRDQATISRLYGISNRQVEIGLSQFRDMRDLRGGSEADNLREFDMRANRLREGRRNFDMPELRDTDGVGAARRRVEDLKLENRLLSERVGILRDVGRELDNERQKIQENVRAAGSRVAAEHTRLGNMQGDFGRLDPSSQGKARAIAKKLEEGGQLTDAEARFLESSGLGGNATENFFKSRGDQAGFGDVKRGLGIDRELRDLETNLRNAQQQEADAMKDVADEITALAEERRAAADQQLRAVEARADAEAESQRRWAAVITKIGQLERDGQKGPLQDPHSMPHGG